MVGVAGDSGAGKTTLARGLVDTLGRERAVAICVGDYHRYDRGERKTLTFTALHPDCNYISIMEQHLRLLSLGHPILKPVYDHGKGTLERPELLEPHEFVVCEGVLALLTGAARGCFDLSVYLDTHEPVRRAWKMRRDVAERGYKEAEVWHELERREPESAAFVRPQRSHADVVVRFQGDETEVGVRPVGATLFVRPTAARPELTAMVCAAAGPTIRSDVVVDEDGLPVHAIRIASDARTEVTAQLADEASQELGLRIPVPEALGRLDRGKRSEPLALTQLILLVHVLATQSGRG